jgi:hypothetical protein
MREGSFERWSEERDWELQQIQLRGIEQRDSVSLFLQSKDGGRFLLVYIDRGNVPVASVSCLDFETSTRERVWCLSIFIEDQLRNSEEVIKKLIKQAQESIGERIGRGSLVILSGIQFPKLHPSHRIIRKSLIDLGFLENPLGDSFKKQTFIR